ncbi:pyridoxamine 5'-phosphate oxidase family protein [Trichlorobacter lovleyi]|uniref:pyridoxamine 5'-phosphate oxidase family protein n=1 Tax=Trichlorobacter lovleyi TaxID=313985 RepID=UPI0023F0467C|nr:pyridoxamine 5'-phosphate oxidase family protein [Trichlorobacter lovleyi]
MQHELRRKDRRIAETEARALLQRGEYGVLSLCSADGEPYGLPLSYCVLDNAIYFHCALEGRKLAMLADNNRASFCVVGATEVVPEKFSTRYESVIVSGRVSEALDAEKQHGLEGLTDKYCPEYHDKGLQYIASDAARTRVFKISIDTICGKARR